MVRALGRGSGHWELHVKYKRVTAKIHSPVQSLFQPQELPHYETPGPALHANSFNARAMDNYGSYPGPQELVRFQTTKVDEALVETSALDYDPKRPMLWATEAR